MSNRPYVTENEYDKWDELPAKKVHPVSKIVGGFISLVFHPLFIPVYLVGLLIITPPYFLGFSKPDKWIAFLRFVMIYSFFPLITVLLLKGLGFIDSIYLRTRKERIIPYIASGIFYFWMWYVLRNQGQFARELVELAFGIFLASSLGLLGNIYMKVSMHAISMGIMVTFVGVIAFTNSGYLLPWLMVSVLVAGLVCTARLLVSNHSNREIYVGLLLGVISQLIATNADFLTS